MELKKITNVSFPDQIYMEIIERKDSAETGGILNVFSQKYFRHLSPFSGPGSGTVECAVEASNPSIIISATYSLDPRDGFMDSICLMSLLSET